MANYQKIGCVLALAVACGVGYVGRSYVPARTVSHAPALASADPSPVQIKSGVAFSVPLTDGTTATARCENMNGVARLTIVTDGKFLDLQLSTWGTGPTPNPTPSPTPPTPIPTPVPVPSPPIPTPPVAVATALIVITDTPTASGSWATPAVQQAMAARGIAATNYAISSVADPNYTDVIGLKWLGQSNANPTPYAFVVDASGNVLWRGPALTTDAAWIALLDKYKPAGCVVGTCPCRKAGAK